MPANEPWSVARWSERSAVVAVREWRRLLPFGPVEHYKARARLTDERSASRTLFLIEAGLIKLSCWTMLGGGRELALVLRRPGDLVGECSGLLKIPQFASAVAVSDCRISRVAIHQAVDILRNSAEAASFLAIRQTIDAIRMAALLLDQRLLGADQRLFQILSDMADVWSADRSSGQVSFHLPLKQEDLADLIAVTPTSFSRLHRRLTRAGSLRQVGRFVSFRQSSAPHESFWA